MSTHHDVIDEEEKVKGIDVDFLPPQTPKEVEHEQIDNNHEGDEGEENPRVHNVDEQHVWNSRIEPPPKSIISGAVEVCQRSSRSVFHATDSLAAYVSIHF